MSPNIHNEIIDKLYALYKSRGFIREEEALDMITEKNLSLQDTVKITDALLGLGIIFADDETSDNDNEIDKTRTDYENIFNQILQISPRLSMFIDYIRGIRPPQWREWQVLMPQAKAGNEYAFNRLFEMYLRVVVKLALYSYKRYEYELDELIQEGALGLIKAIRCFDFNIHDSFVRYFPFWVSQKMNRAVADKSRMIRIPVHMHESMEKYNKKVDELVMRYGRQPSIVEISSEMGISTEGVEQIQRYFYKFESYENLQVLHCDEDFIESNLIDTTPFDAVDKHMIRDAIISSLNTLTNKEASVLRLRFGMDDGRTRTLEEVGTVFNVTRERIRQIEAKAIRKLRHPIRGLKGYLEFTV